jgi:hypothetical protein
VKRRTQKAFILSSVIHGGCLLGLGISALLSKCTEEEPELHVFELVASPPPSSASAAVPPPPSPRVVQPPRPRSRPPTVQPPPRANPKKPVQRLPVKPPSRPVKPPPKKPVEAPPKKINFDDYRSQHPEIAAPPTRSTPAPVPVKPQPFNPNAFRVDVKIPDIQIVGNVSNRDPDALSRYLGRVKSIIENEWKRLKKNSSLSSPGNRMVETKVQFQIGSGGDLRSPRLVRASSYGDFDQLVMRALRSVKRVGQPPFTIDSSLQMTFRLN